MDKAKITLVAILVFGFLLRFVDINNNPKGLYGDELTLVYDAYSILQTGGYDQKGAFLPLVFAQGGGRPGGYVYATIPFVALFGLTPLATRSLSIISGVGLILLFYLLGKRLFSEKVGLMAAFFIAISPWDLALSRGGFETHLALLYSVWAFYLYLVGGRWRIIFSGLLLALAIQTYPTYRLLIPIFAVVLLIFKTVENRVWWKSSKLALAFFLILVYSSTLLGFFLTFDSKQEDRFTTLNIFNQHDTQELFKQKINLERSVDQLPSGLTLLFHNKGVEDLGLLGDNYVKNFNSNFLFLHGDGTPRHNPGIMGEMYLVDFIFVVLGIVYLYKFNKRILFLLFGWLLLAPVPASLVGDPHALRDSFLIPPLIILSALGAVFVFDLTNKLRAQPIRLTLGLVLLIQFGILIDRVYFLSPSEYSNYWGYNAKLTSLIAMRYKSQFDYIILSTQIATAEFAYPVYAKVDPNLVIAENKHMSVLNNLTFRKYDNVYIGDVPIPDIDKFVKNLPGKVLYIGPAIQKDYASNHYEISGTDLLPLLTIVTKPFTQNIQ